jgi:hypothetical protein
MAVLADVSMNNKLFSSAYDCASYVIKKTVNGDMSTGGLLFQWASTMKIQFVMLV